MPRDEQPLGHERRAIKPVYRPSDDGTIVVYAGDLLLTIGADERIVRGSLSLRLSPRSEFTVQVASSDWLQIHTSGGSPLTVGLPPRAVLDPPADLVSSAQPEGAGSEAYISSPINRVMAGELRRAERLLLHVSGPLNRYPLPSREIGSAEPTQPQLPGACQGGSSALLRPVGRRQWTTSPMWSRPSCPTPAPPGCHRAALQPGILPPEPHRRPRDRSRTGCRCRRRWAGRVGRLGRSPLPS
jgi:hypothetical protein